MHLGKRATSLNYHLNSEPEITRLRQLRSRIGPWKKGREEGRVGGKQGQREKKKRKGDKGGEGWWRGRPLLRKAGGWGVFRIRNEESF